MASQRKGVLLLPRPRKVRFGGGACPLPAGGWVLVDRQATDRLVRHVRDVADLLGAATGRRATVSKARDCPGEAVLRVEVGDRTCPAQGYRLTIRRGGMALGARDEEGAFYGLQTLRQILEQAGPAPPAVSIEDGPDIARRGVHLDVSRNKVPKLETLFAYVDMLSGWKVNQLQLYTEHTFAYSRHRGAWEGCSPYTAEDMLRLDAYCRERFVELAPNQNSLGHARPWLARPEYKHLAECPEGSGRFTSGYQFRMDGRTLRFLDELYAEMLPNFRSEHFNVGCDEAKETGLGPSRRRVRERGRIRVYLDFLLKLHKLVRKHGRRMMFWADMILQEPALIDELPEDAVALVWGYERDYPFARNCRWFADAGRPFYVCPGTSSWRTIGGDTDNCLGNQRNAARSGVRMGAEGFLNTDWGDGGHCQHQPVSYPGLAMGAAMAWCYAANRDLDWGRALDLHCFQDAAGVLGDAALGIGRAQSGIRLARNRSPLAYALFAREFGEEFTGRVTREGLARCIEKLDTLEDGLGGAHGSTPDAALVVEELRNTLGMMRHAARRGLAALGAGMSEAELRSERMEIISLHERIWHARNRPGGYHATAAGLRRAVEEGYVLPPGARAAQRAAPQSSI